MDSGRQPSSLRGAVLLELGRRGKLQLVALTVACFVAFLCAGSFVALRSVHAANVPVPGFASDAAGGFDGLGVSYESRLNDGTSASARTRLFDDPADRRAQMEALREDDAYARDDDESERDDTAHDVSYAENKMLFSVCAPAAQLAPAVQCNGRSGYILHLALRGDATSAQEDAAIDRYGARWAAIFARYHPQNGHCALVILASATTAEDEADNDDAGNAILRSKCFTH